jgi:putative hydrolase of the HAD superfamily
VFSAVEIVSEKDAATYGKILRRHAVAPQHFLMVGNSLKSDVLPVLEAGGRAVHVPYVTTWAHEVLPESALRGREFTRLDSIAGLPALFAAV